MARTLDIVAFGSVSDWLAEQLGWLWVGNSPILLTPGSFCMGWSVLPVSSPMRLTDWIYIYIYEGVPVQAAWFGAVEDDGVE